MDKGAIIGVIVLIIIILAGAYLILQNQAMLSGSNAVISLTDPPHVPQGTSSLMITYSALQVHVVNASSSSWVNVQGTGSVDLLTLINVSQVIGNADIAANSTINMVRFNVTSASITINGTTSNVTVPDNRISANISSSNVNGSAQVLVDLSPSIVTIYTNSSALFVLVPSVKAVAFAGGRGYFQIGGRSQLTASEREDIAAGANMSITGDSVASSGNSSTLSVTVKNNGNQSIVIKHIIVSGSINVLVRPFASVNATEDSRINAQRRPWLRTYAGLDASAIGSIGAVAMRNDNITINGTLINSSMDAVNKTINIISSHSIRIDGFVINGSVFTSGNISLNGTQFGVGGIRNSIDIRQGNIVIEGRDTGIRIDGAGAENAASISTDIRARIGELTALGIQINDLKTMAFFVSSNGTLALPGSTGIETTDSGYVLASGAEHTFTFSGTMRIAEGRVIASFVPNDNYSIYVQGEEGAHARANATAS